MKSLLKKDVNYNFRSESTLEIFDQARCREVDPRLFEVDSRWTHKQIKEKTWIPLTMCASCPLRGLQGACVRWVLPQETENDIVAGGWVWVHGRPVINHNGEPYMKELAR
jgi:hypothetical protein